MKRRDILKVLGVMGVGAIAPTVTALAAIVPDRRLRPYIPSHPHVVNPGIGAITAQDFRDLASTVDALVERI